MANKPSVVNTTGKVEEKEGFLEVSRTDAYMGKDVATKRDAQKIKIRPFVTATATVSVKKGITIPTEPYAGVRFDVMISCPCYMEEIVDVFNQVSKLADDLLDKEVSAMNGEAPAENVIGAGEQNRVPQQTTQPAKQDATSGDLPDEILNDIPVREPGIDDLLGDSSAPTVVKNDGGDDIIDDLLGG